MVAIIHIVGYRKDIVGLQVGLNYFDTSLWYQRYCTASLLLFGATFKDHDSHLCNNNIATVLLPFLALSLPFTFLDEILLPSKFFNSSVFLVLEKINSVHLSTSTIYSLPSSLLTTFIITNLILTLIVVVKIINFSSR